MYQHVARIDEVFFLPTMFKRENNQLSKIIFTLLLLMLE